MFGIDEIISTGLKIIDKVIPDPIAKTEAQAKLIELNQNGDLKLEEFDVKREEIAAGDRDSARKREIEIKDKTPAILAGLITLGFFLILGWMIIKGIPETGHDALLLLLGTLSASWAGVVAYYFGSSSGSRSKDATIHNMMNKS